MIKTSVYLPAELDTRLDAEAAAAGVSKAELIRRGVEMVLDASTSGRTVRPLPVFHSGKPLTAAQMDDEIYAHVKERAARR